MSEPSAWVLLVEDDPIFSMLVCRAWKAMHPRVPIMVAASLASTREVLAQAQLPPRLIIMDRSLPDGNGHELAAELGYPSHCWSALGEGGSLAKPQGKPGLEEAVRQLAAQAGF